MARFICWVFAVGLAIGFGPKLVTVTVAVAKVAVRAHLHDQMSYAKFTQKLLNAKPRDRVHRPNKDDPEFSQ